MAAGRRIAGITIEIDGNTTKLTKALADVDKSLKNTQNQIKDIDKLLQIKPTSTELLTQKQDALQKSIGNTKKRLEELKSVQKDSVTSDQWDSVQREIIETEGNLKSLEKEYRNFGSVGAQQVAAVGSAMQEIGGKMTEAGQTLTTHVTVPIVAGLGASAAKFAEVDKTMQLVNSTMGNTAEEADLINQAMQDAAANSTFGMNDAATATLNFARAGLTAEQAAAALAPAMNLAAGEGGNLDTVSGGLVATINGFGDSFDNASDYADVFANACNNSALDVDSLSSAMSVAAPIFSTAGYSVNDAALYMGVMANAGIDANVAANSLKTGLARLVSPAKDGAEMMDKLGISVTNADGTMKDSTQIQQELNAAFGQLSESEQIAAASAIFGKNQMAPWLALINTAPADVNALDTALQEQGTATQMATDMMGGYGGSIEKLKSSLDVLMTSLGEVVAQFLQPVIDKLQELLDWFNSLDEGQQKIIVTIALVVAAIGPLLMGVGSLITMIGSVLLFAPMVVGAIGGIAGVLLPIIAIIAGVIAVGVLLYKNWDKIKETAEKVVKSLKEKWNNFKTDTINKFTEVRDNVKQKFAEMVRDVLGKVIALKDGAVEKFNALKDGAKMKVVEMERDVLGKIISIKDGIKESFENAKEKALGIFDDLKDGIKGKIDWVKEHVEGAVQKIKDIFDFDWSLPDIKLPHFHIDWEDLGFGLSLPHISVNWNRRGYNNPLLFTDPTVMQTGAGLQGFGDGSGGEIVYGHRQLMRDIAEAAGGDANYIVNVYASDGMDVDLLAQKIQDKFVQWQKQKVAAYA